MSDFVEAAKAFHRQPILKARDQFTKSDKKQASEKLKESTKGETLNEWFEKKKTGKDCDAAMPPDGDLIPVGDDDHDFTPSMSAKEKGAESTSGDEWSPEAREKAAEARKNHATAQKKGNSSPIKEGPVERGHREKIERENKRMPDPMREILNH